MQIKHITAVLALFLCPMLHTFAQPKVRFSTKQSNLGLLQWHSPGATTFKVTNKGNKPLLITEVLPDCGCTAVSWTETPIRPGAQGSISVTYDSELLGHFNKAICVVTNTADSITYLRIKGNVVNREIIDTTQFKYKIGKIIMNEEQVEFDNVNRGDQPQQTLNLVNMSKTTYEPELLHLPNYLTSVAQPKRLRPGQKGELIITLNSNLVRDMGLTQTSVYLGRKKGDRVCNENEIPVSIIMVPYFNNLTQAQQTKSPCLNISKTVINFPKLEPKKKYKADVEISNTGSHTLNIKSLQVLHPCLNVDLPKQSLEPGKSVKLRITVLPDFIKRSKSRLRILITTNDPQHPKAFIDVNFAQ